MHTLTTTNFTSTVNQKTRSRQYSAYNSASQSSSSEWLPADSDLTWTRLNWCGRALSTTSWRSHLLWFSDTWWCPSRWVRHRPCSRSPVNTGSWQACHRGQCQMLLSASTTAPHQTFSRRQLGRYILVHAFVAIAGSTTAAVSWFVHQRRQQTSCSVSSMLRPGLSPIPASTIEGWGSSGNVNFTG